MGMRYREIMYGSEADLSTKDQNFVKDPTPKKVIDLLQCFCCSKKNFFLQNQDTGIFGDMKKKFGKKDKDEKKKDKKKK